MQSRAAVDPMVQKEGLDQMSATYLQGADPKNPLASPLHADFAGLPPLLIQVGDAETLLDDRLRREPKLPAAGVAAAAVAVVVVLRGPGDIAGVEQPVTATDFEILLDEQSLEMLEELEFYSWLESVDLAAGDHVG